jgi:hypothetical protein
MEYNKAKEGTAITIRIRAGTTVQTISTVVAWVKLSILLVFVVALYKTKQRPISHITKTPTPTIKNMI